MLNIVNYSPFKVPPYVLEDCPIKKNCICDSTTSSSDDNNLRLELEKLWRVIAPQAYCICLQGASSTSRYKNCTEVFHNVGLCRHVKLYRPERPDSETLAQMKLHSGVKPGAFGSGTSHQMCAKLAHNTNMTTTINSDSKKQKLIERVLIFEDDIELLLDGSLDTLKTHLTEIKKHLTETLSSKKYDMFYLGHSPLFMCPAKLDFSLYRTCSVMIHAYILTRQGMVNFCNHSVVKCVHYNKEKKKHQSQHTGCVCKLTTPLLDMWACFALKQYAYKAYIFDQLLDEPSTQQNTNNPSTKITTQKIIDKIVKSYAKYNRLFWMNASTHQFSNIFTPSFAVIFIIGLILGLYGLRRLSIK